MINNAGNRSNEDVFTERFGRLIDGKGKLLAFVQRFDNFYENVYTKTTDAVIEMPVFRKSVEFLREKVYNLVIARNQISPLKGVSHRIRWAWLDPSDFSYISHFEKSHYCKPQI